MTIVGPFQMKYSFLIYSLLFYSIFFIFYLFLPSIVTVFFAFSLMGSPSRVSRSADKTEQNFRGPESVCHNKNTKYIWNYLVNNLGEEGKMSVWSQKQMAANSGSLMVL